MNNILIIVDLEVIIGVEDLWDAKENEMLLYKEIFTIINSIPEYMDIYLCYDHNDGILPCNLVKDLEPEIQIIKKMNNVDFSLNYKTAFLIGYHGKKSDNCRFPHTYRIEIEKLLLGKKEVGEIEIIINLLSYYKIPVSLISTETVVIDYLDYNCVYHNVDEENINSGSIYYNLQNDVKTALDRKITLPRYNNSDVNIIYNNHVLKRAKEFELDIKTSFKDTVDFFAYLPKLHIPLNDIIKKDNDIQYKLIKNRPESLDLIKDKKIKKLLDKDINLLTYNDLCEILGCFKKIKVNKGVA